MVVGVHLIDKSGFYQRRSSGNESCDQWRDKIFIYKVETL
jgi:hypothetical protein